LWKGRLARPDPVLGHRLFADSVSRAVRLNAAGQQYVLGTDGVLPALCVALFGVILLTCC
jgi:hypothetical protein